MSSFPSRSPKAVSPPTLPEATPEDPPMPRPHRCWRAGAGGVPAPGSRGRSLGRRPGRRGPGARSALRGAGPGNQGLSVTQAQGRKCMAWAGPVTSSRPWAGPVTSSPNTCHSHPALHPPHPSHPRPRPSWSPKPRPPHPLEAPTLTSVAPHLGPDGADNFLSAVLVIAGCGDGGDKMAAVWCHCDPGRPQWPLWTHVWSWPQVWPLTRVWLQVL
jgi:hypothetical protein